MKICQRCQKTYADDNLNFCLDDGSVLTQAGTNQLPQTVVLNEPRLTQQPQQVPYQTGTQAAWNTAPQQYTMQQPPKSSKTWIWVVLILGVVVFLCGGGFVGVFYFVASQANNTAGNYSVNTSKGTPTPSGNKSTNSPPTSGRTDLTTVDLSKEVHGDTDIGVTEFIGGEFFMSSKQKLYYYVVAAPPEDMTESADTKVTLRNVDNASSRLGYGLVFHSDPHPLQQDYAFLIDTKRKKYSLVHHEPQKETPVVSWTSSSAINEGAQENTIEVRDSGDKFDLYINGTMVTSQKNVYGYKDGVAGLYSGDAVRIAFKNLEIRR